MAPRTHLSRRRRAQARVIDASATSDHQISLHLLSGLLMLGGLAASLTLLLSNP